MAFEMVLRVILFLHKYCLLLFLAKRFLVCFVIGCYHKVGSRPLHTPSHTHIHTKLTVTSTTRSVMTCCLPRTLRVGECQDPWQLVTTLGIQSIWDPCFRRYSVHSVPSEKMHYCCELYATGLWLLAVPQPCQSALGFSIRFTMQKSDWEQFSN